MALRLKQGKDVIEFMRALREAGMDLNALVDCEEVEIPKEIKREYVSSMSSKGKKKGGSSKPHVLFYNKMKEELEREEVVEMEVYDSKGELIEQREKESENRYAARKYRSYISGLYRDCRDNKMEEEWVMEVYNSCI